MEVRLRLPAVPLRALVLAASAGLAGCASSSSGGLVDKTPQVVGLRKPEVPAELSRAALPNLPAKVSLRVHAGEHLNTDAQRRSLSVVVRVYKLRSANAFLAAPFRVFGSAEAERQAFGSDLIDVRELVLTPGQWHEVVETMPLEASHLAVVALFRAPSEGRWRFAFKTKDAERSGVTLGLHGCAMSVSVGAPDGAQPETLRLAGVTCQ